MKEYNKPELIEESSIALEGVYAGSGENEGNEENTEIFSCPKNGNGNKYKVNGSCSGCGLLAQAQAMGKCPLA